MNEIITIIQADNHSGKTSLDFLDILLDETLLTGTIYIPRTCLKTASAQNRRLPSKQTYELLLRLALIYPINISDTAPSHLDSYMILSNPPEITLSEAGLRADCYIAARYKETLLAHNLFDTAINGILTVAQQINCQDHIIPFLEDMLSEQADYQYYDQGSQPFLIYTGEDTCYNILSVFAECMGNALQRAGYLVEYFDISKENLTSLSKFINRTFQAVIGMQSCMFSICLESGCLLHDKISGPKYNFIFDHPAYLRHNFNNIPHNYTILTLDQNYLQYARRYLSLNTYFLPPGGIVRSFAPKQRIYDLSFIGSYRNNADEISVQLQLLSRPMRFLVNRFWLNMRKHPDLPAETSLWSALQYYNRQISDQEFTELLFHLQKYVYYLTFRYRNAILKTLLHAGIKVHVFGTSWNSCPLKEHKNFLWHNKDLTTDECLAVWQQSKLSLNMMSWHKNAITERITNSMLQKAVVLTERNPYLEKHFLDGQEIIFYDLAHLERLPKLVSSLLSSSENTNAIGESGCQKALQFHTWDCRAEEFLQINNQKPSASS